MIDSIRDNQAFAREVAPKTSTSDR